MKKNMKSLQIKDSLNKLCQIIPLSEAEEAANSDSSNKHSLGVLVIGVYVINNNWPIQKIDQHQYGGIYTTLSYT